MNTQLLAANNIVVKGNYAFFWGSPFSNWYKAPFEADDIVFPTSEHYMMYMKAILFNDTVTAAKILKTSDPKKAKALGREVKNYSEKRWDSVRALVVASGCFEKFVQNEHLGDLLIATGDLTIVEASPYDRIWGIGMGVDDPNILNESKWKGQNLLGKVLMDIREALIVIRNEQNETKSSNKADPS